MSTSSDKWQVIVERVIRARSVWIQVLPPFRWRWMALLHARFFYWDDDFDLILTKQSHVEKIVNEYQNWLGENRVYR